MTRSELVELFQQELPGEDTHVAFAPIRGRTSEFLAKGLPHKLSAVALVLYKIDEDNIGILVTRRQTYDGKHSGQLSFPGGKKEDSDQDLLQTAIRECFEEIGLLLSPEDLVGKLSQVYIPVSGFLIDPYVFYLDEKPVDFVLNEREVKQLHEVSLYPLFDDMAVIRRDVEVMPGQVVTDIPHFVQGDVTIWGATAILLNELKALFLRNVQ